jgi:hypothetical protein
MPAFSGKLPKENDEMEGGTGKKQKQISINTYILGVPDDVML